MFYYLLVCLVTYINFGLGKSAVTLALEDPSASYENGDSVQTRRALRGWHEDGKYSTEPLTSLQEAGSETKHINLLPGSDNPYSRKFNDPFWPFQWYMHDQRNVLGPVMDHNIVPVYEKGYTGKGVVVGVIGDGVQRKEKLKELPNVNKWSDFDTISLILQGNPKVNDGKKNSEGTMMAGVIGMKENNGICGVGVAFDVTITGLKVGVQLPSSKALDLGLREIKYGHIIYHSKDDGSGTICDIYAFAIGRPDDGIFVPNPFIHYVKKAFKKGIEKGRNGLGSIYVIGAGDGKTSGEDNCGADDLVNNPATIAIASADHLGRVTPYSERCAAVMATAYSSGDDQAIVTTDADGSCTKKYSGNNPSVGIAAGIFALTLQANPQLTPRDLQYLVALTSEVAPLVENKGTWQKNAAGFYVSSDFGFGLLNAENMIMEAEQWITLPPELVTKEKFKFDNPDVAVGTVLHKSQIKFVELVELICNARLQFRGSIKINLKSPSGTEVAMLEVRPRDRDPNGLWNWRLKTAHFWGEAPEGTWTLTSTLVQFEEDPPTVLGAITKYLDKMFGPPNRVNSIKLVIHGTEERPASYKRITGQNTGRRTYSAFYSEELHGQNVPQSG